ncbi:hypothetical protein ACN47E_004547 [Coniothyrium glycines]
MSDYGDDYSDYADEWYYVEDEYMPADDLAEHAVASPPPTTSAEEEPEWDRFEYFNDIEYASDGYNDADSEVQDVKTGQKRKRVVTKAHRRKRRSTAGTSSQADTSRLEHSPIVWRLRSARETKPELLDENAKPYALLKDWRDKLADTPPWVRAPPQESLSTRSSRPGKGKAARSSAPVSPPCDIDFMDPEHVHDEVEEHEIEEHEVEEDFDMDISQDAIMAALQRQLAAAGGPLSDMDPQQLLEFAMRMAAGKDHGDDIAGEMAEAMLEGEDDEDDADAEESLLSWVAQQRNADKKVTEESSNPCEVSSKTKRPPTPPSSETNRGIHVSETTSKATRIKAKTHSLKRKADEHEDQAESSTKAVKKRITSSFDAPTAASQAKAALPKTTRTTRGKKA